MRNTSKPARVLIYIGLIFWALINLFPVYWVFTFSLKNNEEIYGANPIGLPQHWLWSNYTSAMKTGKTGLYFLNSGIVAVATFPTLFMYIFLSKKIQESFIAGAVKG